MPHGDPVAEARAIAAEQIKGYYKETGVGNVLGAVVFSLIVWGNATHVPVWTWAPSILAVYIVTAIRGYLFLHFQRRPEARTTEAWARAQTVCAAIAGIAWGAANTAMCFHLPVENQLFVAAVAAVAASYAAAGGIAYVPPPFAFIVTSLLPLTAWFYAGVDRLHLTLAVMLTIYGVSTLMQGVKRNRGFVESLQLRFKNEFLARELAQQIEIADAAALAKTRFLAAASHDLRQPVQALTIFQELIRPEMKLTPKGEGFFGTMQQAVKSVHGLLDALLDVSKLDADAIQVQREPFRLAELFDRMRIEFGLLAAQKGIDLRIAQSSVVLNTDPMLLGQLLRNLVSNALRYTNSGKVLLGFRRRKGRPTLEVWDTGIGIQSEHQRAIFSEFVQVGNRERDRQKGLGLGLAIADRVAKLLGATIEVRSTIGKGSCFSVDLPSCLTPPAFPATIVRDSHEPEAPTLLEGSLIVVVENEDAIRNGIQEFLESFGCEVISGPSLENVSVQMQNFGRTVDAVISDFGLPGEANGIEVIRQLRQDLGYEVAALLITGDTSSSVMDLVAGADIAILYKPVQPNQLQQTVSTMLSQ
jgi:signal transduction histidine kinase/CheY-like chemotaxis protein